MELIALSNIITCREGKQVELNHGDYFSIDAVEGQRLLDLKVAELNRIPFYEDEEEVDDDAYPDYAGLKRMKKAELVAYGCDLGLELDETMKNDQLINEIINHIEELQDEDFIEDDLEEGDEDGDL